MAVSPGDITPIINSEKGLRGLDVAPTGAVVSTEGSGLGVQEPIADGDYTTLGGDVFTFKNGMCVGFVVGT